MPEIQVLIGPDGSMKLGIPDGDFDDGARKLVELISELQGEGFDIEASAPEQHSHAREETEKIHLHGS